MSLENNESPEIQEDNVTEPLENEIDNETNADNDILSETFYEDDFENENKVSEKNSKSKSSKILYIIYAIVIILCLAILTRNLFFKNNRNNKAASSSVISSESIAENAPKKIMDLYVLADLPEEYEQTSQDISNTKAVSIYKNETTEITLTQSTIDSYEPEYDVNDKDIVISDFHSGAGQKYRAYQIDGKCYIVWTTDEYTFEIKTSMKKSESIPFIFNVQKTEQTSSSDKSE